MIDVDNSIIIQNVYDNNKKCYIVYIYLMGG